MIGTIIIAAISILLVFELLKLIVRIIFAIENMKDNPYLQLELLMPTPSKHKLLRQLNWFIVYSRFLCACQIQIWKIRVQRTCLYIRSGKANHRKGVLRIISRAEKPLKDSAYDFITAYQHHSPYDRTVANKSFNQNAITQFLLFLCSSENQVKLKRKTDQQF